MTNKERQKPARIPVHFADDQNDDGKTSQDEVGAEMSFSESDADEQGVGAGAGESYENDAAAESEEVQEIEGLEESSDAENDDEGAPRQSGVHDAGEQQPTGMGGPALAELIATRSELKRVQAALDSLTEERKELQERLARRQADFENYRKRVERERAETYNRVTSDLVAQLLPVVDNLQRALEAEASIQASESNEFRHFLHGVELIGRQLTGVLESLGVQPVPTVGLPFDPHVHEAVATEETDEFEPDTVTAELVRGYRIGDKLIRPAMVRVAK